MAFLNLDIGITAYQDAPLTSAPLLKTADWTRTLRGLNCVSPGTFPVAPIPAGGSATILDGSRTLTVDGTTAFALTSDPLDPTMYFLTWTGGTTPGFRADRGLNLTGDTLSVTPQTNGSVLFTITNLVLGSFSGVSVGDNVFIPGISTGATAGPFNPTNEGLWVVLSTVDAQNVILVRPPSSANGYAAQTGVVISAAIQFQAFSAAGVQVGDSVDLSAGLALPSALLDTFTVTGVTGQQLTIQSTNPLPLVTGFMPTAAGINVYSQAFNFLYIEADQDCAVQCNGDTGQSQRLSPWNPSCGCSGLPGSYMKTGPTWELTVVNRSTNPLNLVVITAA
jgi:hypothetical protein